MACSRSTLPAALVLLLLPPLAGAQVKIAFDAPKPGTVDILTPVVVPDARCVSLGEAQRLLAFGHDRLNADADLSLVKLDAKGIPSAAATRWKVPAEKWQAKLPSYVLSVALHPKLPLLYVWRDLPLNYAAPAAAHPPQHKAYDHLLIYDVAKETPELLVSMCRGDEYSFGQQGGELAADPSGQFLYVPNVKEHKTTFFHFGRFRLDSDGLPDVLQGADVKLPLAQRGKRISELNVAKSFVPAEQTPTEYIYILTGSPFGCGHSFHLVSNEAIIAGGWNGLIAWRPGDKVTPLHALPMRSGVKTLIKAHPHLPSLYATAFNTDSLYRAEHAEGYLTLVPQQWIFPEAKLTSHPAVFAKGRKIAVGGHYGVYVITLDDQGRATSDVTLARVFNPMVRALTYSPQFDRLYVGVELSK
jgi:hypothetical protein